MLEYELVTRVKFDARLSIDALSAQLCTELALGFRPITS